MRTMSNATVSCARSALSRANALALVTAMTAMAMTVLTGATLGACSSDDASSPVTTTGQTEAEPQTFTDQVTAGQKVYGASCAGCHGAAGEGTKDAPRVVGLDQGALPLNPPPGAKVRTTQFKTAADVAAFVVTNMPADKPGSLAEWQYWSVLAFALKANGVTLGAKLDGAVAAGVVLHP